MKKKRYFHIFLLPLLILCIFVSAVPIQTNAAVKKETNRKAAWVKKNSKYYYYNEKGKKITGLKEIKNKYYYLDKKGVQHVGWQKIKGNYYFFKISNGKNGYMLKNTKVDGVTLKKTGKAKLTTDSKAKLNVLIKANKIVEKVTKPAMTKAQKLRKCFDYSLKHFQYRGSPRFYPKKHWDRSYALDMFDRGGGNCYAYGAAFAYLANAIGYTKVAAISSGGHGWAEVNGKVYDPSWHLVAQRQGRNISYYGMSYNLSGVGGRPGYKGARKYVVWI